MISDGCVVLEQSHAVWPIQGRSDVSELSIVFMARNEVFVLNFTNLSCIILWGLESFSWQWKRLCDTWLSIMQLTFQNEYQGEPV